MKISVYDPAMCCSSGVCGPSVDPKLSVFSADLDWLKSRGIEVERFNLAQQPQAFADNPDVASELGKDPGCLPLILVDGAIMQRGGYPDRAALKSLCRISADETPAKAPAGCGCKPGACC